jgi:protein-S-isoprenylcysteine O-methyltransferase Ste14
VAGGALWACAAFCAAFALYVATVVPQEERMLREAFGEKYARYM